MTALLLFVALAQAPGDGQAQATSGAPAQAPLIGATDDTAYQIGKELRCPVCQGMPIAESPSDMAQAMMQRVREMVAEGKSKDEIRSYFVARYGEWVLLRPTSHGFNVLIWALPPVALVLGVGAMLFVVRRGKRSASKADPAGQVPESLPADDPYLAEVRRRLEQGDI